jgi:thymidylate synthase ThyX
MSFEEAAYMLPKAAKYKLVVTGNFRAWFEYLPKRLCHRAQQEHQDIAAGIKTILAAEAPEIFNRNFMSCDHCSEWGCNFHV